MPQVSCSAGITNVCPGYIDSDTSNSMNLNNFVFDSDVVESNTLEPCIGNNSISSSITSSSSGCCRRSSNTGSSNLISSLLTW